MTRIEELENIIKQKDEEIDKLQRDVACLKNIVSYETKEVQMARMQGLVSPQEYRDKLIESQAKEISKLQAELKRMSKNKNDK